MRAPLLSTSPCENGVPVLLGDGERLFGNLGEAEPQLEQVRTVDAPGITHVKCRATRG